VWSGAREGGRGAARGDPVRGEGTRVLVSRSRVLALR